MEAWLVYYRSGAEYNRNYIQFYIEEGNKLDITVKLILVEDLEFGVWDNQWFLKYQNQYVQMPDFIINRAIYPLLSKQFELMGIRVFNNSFIADICNDKAKTYQYLAKTGIKMVNSSFFRNHQLKQILIQSKPKSIIKAVEGHGGSQVFQIDKQEQRTVVPSDKDFDHKLKIPIQKLEKSYSADISESADLSKSADISESVDLTESVDLSKSHDFIEKINSDKGFQNIINGIGNSDVVLQPFTGSKHQDLRVYVIGKEIIAAVLRTAREGFKSNFSLGGDVQLYELSENEKNIITIIVNQFDFGLVGIDFIIGDEGELIFNEIEDVVGARMLYQCADINLVEKYLKFIIKRYGEDNYERIN